MTFAPIVARLNRRRAWIMQRLDLIEAEAAGHGLEPGPQIALEMLRTEAEFLTDLIRTLRLIAWLRRSSCSLQRRRPKIPSRRPGSGAR